MENLNEDGTAQDLKQLYRTSAPARAILDNFAGRTNTQRITKVEQVLKRFHSIDMQRSAVIAFFRELEKLCYGRFIEGRKGHPSRFEWSSNSVFVGRSAKAEPEEALMASVTASPQTVETASNCEGLLKFSFPIRSGVTAYLSIPPQLLPKEAERLALWVSTLAIPVD